MSKLTKKILYFDYWDVGYRNFLRLDRKFKENDFQSLLLHTASWTGEETEKEKEIEGLKLRDISFYKTIRLKNVIIKENPTAIIILNLSFLLDRVFVQICKELRVPIFHLAHGKLVTIESVTIQKTNSRKRALIKKIDVKNIYSLYNYLLEYGSVKKVFSLFYRMIKNHTEFTTLPKYCSELEVNKSFVYYQSDYDLMVKEFEFPKDKVNIIGNPELDVFYNSKLKNKKDYCSKDLNIKTNTYVAYIDDGLSEIQNWDMEKWKLFLIDVNSVLRKNEIQLIVKLHPRRIIEEEKSFFEENDIKYFHDIDFKNFLEHSLFVLSHYSSVIVYALLLKKKVKSPRWGVSKNLVEQYPVEVVNYYYEKDHFEESIFEIDINEDRIQEYIIENIGKVDGKSTDRIVDRIIKDIKVNV
ncbi:hypothetical protein [Flavivirga rizhaonensis]|uniref:Uncharacterized protein n=1 Tax=Flavivirga rizhaonensis TaxID=2559571 RepID=A0A4V3P542_9FLAO|nr:hypothetical protein [Flavivirga rizhaonensis]TGV03844.1 hypothetical protein EM932_05375 [Flavivirga rizhaonensis]